MGIFSLGNDSCREDNMRDQRTRWAFAAAIVLGAASVCAAQAFAQGRRGAPAAPGYDLKAEVTLQVTVTEVKRIEGPAGQSGVHLMVKSGSATLEVDLGPEWFLTERKYTFAVGDELSVTGARVKRTTGDALVAREVKRGEQTISLRDAKGFPLWAGRGRGSQQLHRQ
jgi:hypothetical protein